jgi:hypothetical protein
MLIFRRHCDKPTNIVKANRQIGYTGMKKDTEPSSEKNRIAKKDSETEVKNNDKRKVKESWEILLYMYIT